MIHTEINGISVTFLDPEGKKEKVLDKLSLSLKKDEIVTILGPNASGKSTLLNVIAGFLQVDEGNVTISTNHDGSPHIGYVWQNYREALLPWFDVGENIAFPLKIKGIPYKERRLAAAEIAEKFGRGIDINKKVYELSGGQQQLVGILRTLTVDPDIILLDEPFSALDMQARWSISQHFEKIWINKKVPVLFVSHDIDEAISLADRILLLSRKHKNVIHVLKNTNPRPRTPEMFSSAEHLGCRKAVVDFFHNEGVL